MRIDFFYVQNLKKTLKYYCFKISSKIILALFTEPKKTPKKKRFHNKLTLNHLLSIISVCRHRRFIKRAIIIVVAGFTGILAHALAASTHSIACWLLIRLHFHFQFVFSFFGDESFFNGFFQRVLFPVSWIFYKDCTFSFVDFSFSFAFLFCAGKKGWKILCFLLESWFWKKVSKFRKFVEIKFFKLESRFFFNFLYQRWNPSALIPYCWSSSRLSNCRGSLVRAIQASAYSYRCWRIGLIRVAGSNHRHPSVFRLSLAIERYEKFIKIPKIKFQYVFWIRGLILNWTRLCWETEVLNRVWDRSSSLDN